jgi:hypothetical protein
LIHVACSILHRLHQSHQCPTSCRMLAGFPHLPQTIKIKWKLVLKRFVGTTRSQYQNCKSDNPRFKRLLSAVFLGKLLAYLRPAYDRLITNEIITLLQDSQSIKTIRPLIILYFKILGVNILFTRPRNALCKT